MAENTSSNKTIVIHNGLFHADEVFATAILQIVFDDEYEVVRTRDADLIIKYRQDCFQAEQYKKDKSLRGNFIVDIGKVYDPEIGLFDHHQKPFVMSFDGRTEPEDDDDIPMSSCGMVYKQFGKELLLKEIGNETGEYLVFKNMNIEKLVTEFYYHFIQQIDADDNGIPYIRKDITELAKLEDSLITNYHCLSIPSIIREFNTNNVSNDKQQLIAFNKATSWAKNLLLLKVHNFVFDEFQFKTDLDEFKKALEPRLENQERFVVIKRPMNVNRILKELDPMKNILFIISPNGKYETDCQDWRIMTRRTNGFDFEAPVIKEEEAKELFGDSVTFVHAKRFVGGCKSLTCAVQVAKESIRQFEQNELLLAEKASCKKSSGLEDVRVLLSMTLTAYLLMYIFVMFVSYIAN